jgi:hypothetical protein
MYALRSTIVMRTIKATFGTIRIKCVLAGQGFVGYAAGGLNQWKYVFWTARLLLHTTDTLTVSGGFGTPISNHDAFATATYFDGGPAYYNGQFITDSANYASGNPTTQAAAIASFISEVTSISREMVSRSTVT